MIVQIATIHQIKDETKFFGRLEGISHAHYEGTPLLQSTQEKEGKSQSRLFSDTSSVISINPFNVPWYRNDFVGIGVFCLYKNQISYTFYQIVNTQS